MLQTPGPAPAESPIPAAFWPMDMMLATAPREKRTGFPPVVSPLPHRAVADFASSHGGGKAAVP